MWCALCSWTDNIHIAVDFLVNLSVGASSTWLLEQVCSHTLLHSQPHLPCVLQAKKVVVFLGRASPTRMVNELMKELEV